MGLVAAMGALAVDAWYLSIIASQASGLGDPRVLFVASSIGAAGLVVGAASIWRGLRGRTVLFSAGTAALILLGLFGIFSIGILLLLCGGLAAVAAVGALRARPFPLAGAMLGALVVVAAIITGFSLT